MSHQPLTHVLLLGYSAFARKTVISSIDASTTVRLTGIASVSKYAEIPNKYRKFPDYKTAIEQSDCDTVYISLPHSAHVEWILYSLKLRKHVLVDKPAVLTGSDAKKIEILAKAKNLLVYESLPYLFHQQQRMIREITNNDEISYITAHFGFPALEPTNFRNHKELGGGCLYDQGPYLVATALTYFAGLPSRVLSIVKMDQGIPRRAAVTLYYENGSVLHGLIGMNLEYHNHLELWGKDAHVALERAFSLPKDQGNTITTHHGNTVKTITVPAMNAFTTMLEDFVRQKISFATPQRRLNEGSKSQKNSLINRATILEAMVKSARTGHAETIIYG